LFFRNYIISTDVGSASDLIKMGYGKIIPQNDPVYLSGILQKIINENNPKAHYGRINWENNDVSWENYIRIATKDLYMSWSKNIRI
jgi:hypothetical protein